MNGAVKTLQHLPSWLAKGQLCFYLTENSN